MNTKITIPGEMPGMNEIIEAAKKHHMKYAEMKKVNTEVVAYTAKHIHKMSRIFLNITWYCKNKKKDPDNIAAGGTKFICDGLVQAGVLENDGWAQIEGFSHSFKIDKNNPRIEIEIREV